MSGRRAPLQRAPGFVACLAGLLLAATPAAAQIDGHVSVTYDVLPNLDIHELRARLFAERTHQIGDHLRVVVGAYLDGLAARRDTTAIVRPADVYVEVAGERAELRAGMSRIVWGRLDEFQPTDVVNPIDLSRFLLEGRSEARLPVALVRGRVFFDATSTIEAVVVPWFRPGRFDQLAEETSPFDLQPFPFPEPEGPQGGARFTSTVARVDWGVSAYRGIRGFAPFSRFTMAGADFETVRGPWGVRGEVAAFSDDESVAGGIGMDRRAGDYRLAGNVLWSSEEGASLVGAADRSFARQTRTLRVFAVVDPGDGTAFARVIASFLLRENTWLEASGGLFAGSSSDVIGRLTRRDFAYLRLKVFL